MENDDRERIQLRLSVEGKRIVEEAANIMGMTVNAFATAQIIKAAIETITQTRGLTLDEKAKKKFVEMLDNPDGLNQALKEAAEKYSSFKL